MARGYLLSPEALKQVQDVVRQVLRTGADTSNPPRPPTPHWPTPTYNATPDTTVGATGETEAAATDVWQVYDADDGLDLKLTMCTRVAYADAGDETLYAYYRDLFFDWHGRLTRVSAETRVSVDVPEACA